MGREERTMETREIKWECYPHVRDHPAAHTFVERLALKGKRPKTVDAYARAVEDLLAHFANRTPSCLIEADETDLDGYIASLKLRSPKRHGRGGVVEEDRKILPLTGRKLSDNTIAQRVVACRLFYDFLIRKRLRCDPVNPIERGNDGRHGQRPSRGPASPKQRLPWVPSDDVWHRFLEHIILREDARTRAMILLAYDAALRREELMLLRMDDIDFARGILTIRAETTKNGRMRYVPVSPAVLYLVRTYLDGERQDLIVAYGGDMTGPLFLSESTRNPGRPLAIGAFDEIVERVRERVGLLALTPHTFRHQRCTQLKRAGVSLDDIALFAGHKNVDTTRLYTHLAPDELSKRIQERIEPFDRRIQMLIEQAIGKSGFS